MAIDKSRTSPFVKAVIIALAAIFALTVGGVAIVPLLESFTSSGRTPSTGATGGNAAAGTEAAIGDKYAGRIAASDATLKTDPNNYDVLVAQARSYQDWATEIMQLNQKAGGSDLPLLQKSLDFYKRALAVKAGDPNVTTDMAIVQFYSGDVNGAIATAQALIKKDPKFSPVHFNLGIFYGQAGDNARAIAEWQTYLSLDPTGAQADSAKKFIAEYQAKGPGSPSLPATGSAPATQ